MPDAIGSEGGLVDSGLVVCPAPEEFDMLTAQEFRSSFQEAISQPDIKRIAVCLGQTTFIDGSGINALIESRREAEARNTDFTIRNAGRLSLRLLEATDMMEFLSVETES